MKQTILTLCIAVFSVTAFAQKKVTTSAVVAFNAATPKDKLPVAENKTVIAALNTSNGDVQFEAAVKNFAFSNPTMQSHFNSDKWLDSDKFPKFTFSGKLADAKKVNFAKDGVYKVDVGGTLKVKDIEKAITVPTIITVEAGKISATSSFKITLADYGIKGVAINGGKVAKQPTIDVSATF